MNKAGISIFIIILFVFGLIFYTTQSGQGKDLATEKTQTLPSGSEVFQPINQGQTQNQSSQQTQQQAGQQTPQDLQGPLNASISASIKTSKGVIKVTLFGKDAQNTVRNFISKAQAGFYTNLTFHRVEDWVIQGGDPKGDGTGGGQMPTETNALPFVIGSLGVARGSNPQISNDAQFFITKTPADWLNNQYTNFGIVTSGMEVVNKIQIGDKILGITVGQ